MTRGTRILGALALVASASSAAAQSLATRVAAAPEGRVQFSFAARDGVCGDGRGLIGLGGDSWIGSYTTGDGVMRDRCEPGPVRVVVVRAESMVIGIETFVGAPPAPARALVDLGPVRARDAAEYLLSLAARLDGRPGRDAILPAALADSTDPMPALLAIARDGDRPRETRRSALSWLARAAREPAAARRAAEAMVALARAGEEHAAVRQHSLSTLARLEHGAGVPALVSLSRQAGDDAWLAREALEALARSGDPRARDHLRAVVQRADLPEALLVVAVRGLAREYATARDAALLRGGYARLQGERVRQAVLTSLAELGGSENARWLLDVARRTDERPPLRRQALHAAVKAGAPTVELARLYDGADPTLREQLLPVYAESGERAAVDRLIAVARNLDDPLRRRAIQHLGRVDDPRVKALLAELAVR
ncbi:MAG TPA: HEAT repeat domain-containing protein [Gemmatimonadaceae bacterium]|nr:HEAT repeat domain-containing protein [Gemmatimonadaceae bacterium]